MKVGSDGIMNKLPFFKISDIEVRQLGEMSKDNGASWQVEYDLTYIK